MNNTTEIEELEVEEVTSIEIELWIKWYGKSPSIFVKMPGSSYSPADYDQIYKVTFPFPKKEPLA